MTMHAMVVTALQDTYLKKKAINSDALPEDKKVFVPKGKSYRIVWKTGKKDGHVRVTLSDFAGSFFLYFPHWEGLESVPPAAKPLNPKDEEEVRVFKTEVQALNLSQPDAVTCQSACIGMAVGDRDIQGIRKKLQALGNPGNPYVMGKVIRQYGVNYKFDENASLSEVRAWLRAGEFLITHGWFSGSGHVICLDGLKADQETLSYSFDVKDPYGEFDAPLWKYKPNVKFFDGYYSSHLIYAACVRSVSVAHAQHLYNKKELDSNLKGMWIHRITA